MLFTFRKIMTKAMETLQKIYQLTDIFLKKEQQFYGILYMQAHLNYSFLCFMLYIFLF